jgi:hypothetical protein
LHLAEASVLMDLLRTRGSRNIAPPLMIANAEPMPDKCAARL